MLSAAISGGFIENLIRTLDSQIEHNYHKIVATGADPTERNHPSTHDLPSRTDTLQMPVLYQPEVDEQPPTTLSSSQEQPDTSPSSTPASSPSIGHADADYPAQIQDDNSALTCCECSCHTKFGTESWLIKYRHICFRLTRNIQIQSRNHAHNAWKPVHSTQNSKGSSTMKITD